jgi:hypothetical protein
MINNPLFRSVRQADKVTCAFISSYIARDAVDVYTTMDVYYATKSNTGRVINPIYFDIIGLVSEICSHEQNSKNKQS